MRGRIAMCAAMALATLGVLSVSATVSAQWPFGHKGHEQPPTVEQVARALDDLEDDIRDDGIVVIKQPDVWGQSRMTRYRVEFERYFSIRMHEMANNFEQNLQAIIARSDNASFESRTALGAVLTPTTRGANGRRNPVEVSPTDVSNTSTSLTSNIFTAAGLPTTQTKAGDVVPVRPFGSSTLFGDEALIGKAKGLFAGGSDGIAVEPSVQLDEFKRFLDAGHQIRRINLGDDNADAAGYGLYLVRMPVSIQPGETTRKGYGAQVMVTMQHEFSPDFLETTYRNLVIADVLDVLAPAVYEAMRSGVFEERKRIKLEIENTKRNITELENQREQYLNTQPGKIWVVLHNDVCCELEKLEEERDRYSREKATVQGQKQALTDAQQELADVNKQVSSSERSIVSKISVFTTNATTGGAGAVGAAVRSAPGSVAQSSVDRISANLSTKQRELDATRTRANKLLERIETSLTTVPRDLLPAALPAGDGDLTSAPKWSAARVCSEIERCQKTRVEQLIANVLQSSATSASGDIERALTQAIPQLSVIDESAAKNIVRSAASSMTLAKNKLDTLQFNNLANKSKFDDLDVKLKSFFNNLLPSQRVASQSYPISPSDFVPIFGLENLERLVSDTDSVTLTKTPRATDIRAYLQQELQAAYDQIDRYEHLIEPIGLAIRQRQFSENPLVHTELSELFRQLRGSIPGESDPIKPRVIDVLAWAIAVDAALLNEQLRKDIQNTIGTNGFACVEPVEGLAFHYQKPPGGEENWGHPYYAAQQVFEDYVRARWPIITFALDPVVDQQNLADALSRTRDLQLAIAYAFAAGRINFQQMNRYSQRLQYEAATINLNRTVSSFAYGNDTFGWRFAPRYQNPPEEASNIHRFANLAIKGGPGRNYQSRNSLLEPGLRELSAVVIMPSILQKMRMEVSGNWYPLHDPDEMEIKTARMLKQGRMVTQLRQALVDAEACGIYRPGDIQRLATRIDQVESMLPLQTRHVQVPYENTLGGFQLFTQGSTALVPQLIGYEGIDKIDPAKDSEILIFGKYINLYDTNIMAGGKTLMTSLGLPTFNGSGTPTTSETPKEAEKKAAEPNVTPAEAMEGEILSRNIVRVKIKGGVDPTVFRAGADGKHYLEVYLATPNGISNRVLIPVNKDVPAKPEDVKVALATPELRIVAEWSEGCVGLAVPCGETGKHHLCVTGPPDPAAVEIRFEPADATPEHALVTISGPLPGTLGHAQMRFLVPTLKGRIVVPAHLVAEEMLKQLNARRAMIPTVGLPIGPIPLTVRVQASDGAGLPRAGQPLVLPTSLNLSIVENRPDGAGVTGPVTRSVNLEQIREVAGPTEGDMLPAATTPGAGHGHAGAPSMGVAELPPLDVPNPLRGGSGQMVVEPPLLRDGAVDPGANPGAGQLDDKVPLPRHSPPTPNPNEPGLTQPSVSRRAPAALPPLPVDAQVQRAGLRAVPPKPEAAPAARRRPVRLFNR